MLGLWGSRRSRVARCRRASDADFFPSFSFLLWREKMCFPRGRLRANPPPNRACPSRFRCSPGRCIRIGEKEARGGPGETSAWSSPRNLAREPKKKKTAAAEIRRLIFSIPRRRPPLPNLPPVPRSPPQIRTCARVLAAPQSPRPAAASCSTAETRLQSRPCCASALRKTSCSIGVHGARGRECELELGSPGPRAPNSASEVETSGSMGP